MEEREGQGKKVLHSLQDVCFPIVVANLRFYKELPSTLSFQVQQTLVSFCGTTSAVKILNKSRLRRLSLNIR